MSDTVRIWASAIVCPREVWEHFAVAVHGVRNAPTPTTFKTMEEHMQIWSVTYGGGLTKEAVAYERLRKRSYREMIRGTKTPSEHGAYLRGLREALNLTLNWG